MLSVFTDFRGSLGDVMGGAGCRDVRAELSVDISEQGSAGD